MDVVINSDCLFATERARSLSSQGTGLLNFLCCLGYSSHKPPLADLLRQYHHLEGKWLILSPIHWQATHNDALILAHGSELELSDAETKHWFDVFAQHLNYEGMELHYHNADFWLLRVDTQPELQAKPIHQVMNQSLMPELEKLDPSLYWQKFITESQMFFAAHSNDTTLNGVWLWGGGSLSQTSTVSICADAYYFDLASICSAKVSLYTPQSSLAEFDIILFNDFNTLSDQHKKQLSHKTVNWYWNNTAYTLHDKNWLIKLWRALIHAH